MKYLLILIQPNGNSFYVLILSFLSFFNEIEQATFSLFWLFIYTFIHLCSPFIKAYCNWKLRPLLKLLGFEHIDHNVLIRSPLMLHSLWRQHWTYTTLDPLCSQYWTFSERDDFKQCIHYVWLWSIENVIHDTLLWLVWD